MLLIDFLWKVAYFMISKNGYTKLALPLDLVLMIVRIQSSCNNLFYSIEIQGSNVLTLAVLGRIGREQEIIDQLCVLKKYTFANLRFFHHSPGTKDPPGHGEIKILTLVFLNTLLKANLDLLV